MSAILGFCLQHGVFLAGDSRWTAADSRPPWPEPVRKIVPVTQNVVVATAQSGEIADRARDSLVEAAQRAPMTVAEIVDTAQEVFRRRYAQALLAHPGHNDRLTCILAGWDPTGGSGFICVLESGNGFESRWIQPGKPYFAGPTIDLLVTLASEVFNELKIKKAVLHLDEWAVETIHRLKTVETSVSFPMQLVFVDQQLTDVFPVEREVYDASPRFTTRYPKI